MSSRDVPIIVKTKLPTSPVSHTKTLISYWSNTGKVRRFREYGGYSIYLISNPYDGYSIYQAFTPDGRYGLTHQYQVDGVFEDAKRLMLGEGFYVISKSQANVRKYHPVTGHLLYSITISPYQEYYKNVFYMELDYLYLQFQGGRILKINRQSGAYSWHTSSLKWSLYNPPFIIADQVFSHSSTGEDYYIYALDNTVPIADFRSMFGFYIFDFITAIPVDEGTVLSFFEVLNSDWATYGTIVSLTTTSGVIYSQLFTEYGELSTITWDYYLVNNPEYNLYRLENYVYKDIVICFSNDTNRIVGFNWRTGTVEWELYNYYMNLKFDDNSFFATDKTTGQCHCIDVSTGTIRFSITLLETNNSVVFIHRNQRYVFIEYSTSYYAIYDLFSGTYVNTNTMFQPHSDFFDELDDYFMSIMYDLWDNLLFVDSDSGKMVMYNSNMTEQWRYQGYNGGFDYDMFVPLYYNNEGLVGFLDTGAGFSKTVRLCQIPEVLTKAVNYSEIKFIPHTPS